jgi:RimJ/RimL family protein N-acetyltransferase
MGNDPTAPSVPAWRAELPVLTGQLVTLREPGSDDRDGIADLLSLVDATRFGSDGPISRASVLQFIERLRQERSAGVSFTYAVTIAGASPLVGLIQVRQLDPAFEAAEWECTIATSSRGTGTFVEAARLAGSFAFVSVGTHRLEARVLLQDGRGNSALRKIGAVQEGILRRSVRRGGQYLDQVLWSVLRDDWTEFRLEAGSRVH